MKYETPKLTALTPAINAIQGTKVIGTPADHLGSEFTEVHGAYADWE
jgi:hypothetical protein